MRYLLTGLAICGECGAALVGHPLGARGASYACVKGKGGCGRVTVLASRLEPYVVVSALDAKVTTERRVREPDAALLALQSEATDLEARIAEANRRAITLGMSDDEHRATVRPWRERLEAIEREVAAAQVVTPPPEPVDTSSLMVDASLAEMLDPEEFVEMLADEETRAGVRAFLERRVERVVVRAVGRTVPIEERADIVWREGVEHR